MKLRHIASLLLALCQPLCALAEPVLPNAALPIPKFMKNVAVHDPSIVKADDGLYYIFGSHMAAATSADLIDWKLISSGPGNAACTLVKNVQEEMKEVLRYARTDTFWAPDVVKLSDGRYCMYYCTCEGTMPLSGLGYAVSDRPEGPYKDMGILLKSGYPGYNPSVLPNVVDPCAFYDKENRLWMVYGSYSGGIFILEMDKDTGRPLDTEGNRMNQGYGKKLLGGNHAQIEGPYVLYSPDTDYYYLFLSYGGLAANDGYNIRVCRSESPDGPYEDAEGKKMIRASANGGHRGPNSYEPYGAKIIGGYEFLPFPADKNRVTVAYRSPGHNSAYYDEETGRYFLIFHTRFANAGEAFQVRVHQMYMNKEGWPVVSPLRYAGEMPQPVEAQAQCGIYKVLLHGRDINNIEHQSMTATLHPGGAVTGDVTGTWHCKDGVSITLSLSGHTYCGVMHTALDAGQRNWTSCISAMDETGASLWAIRAYGQDE